MSNVITRTACNVWEWVNARAPALVPMYRTICDALGINVLSVSERVTSAGLAAASSRKANTQVDRSRTVTIEFDANARGP